jgi:hypothetical protein
MHKANEHQVGGHHYSNMANGTMQHWDMVHEFGLDYFQGQITKYVLRWKHKHRSPLNRLEDLKKARHFLDKYIEIEEGELRKLELGASAFHAEPGRGYVNQDQC